jgi:hypothetical protein
MDNRQPAEPAPGGGGRFRRHWKRAAFGVLVLFVAVSVGRSLLPALGIRGPGGGKPSGQHTTKAKNLPPPTATLDGMQILGGGAPIVTLNPGLVRPGATVAVSGSGFDAGSRVDLLLGTGTANKAKLVTTVTAGKGGVISGSVAFPTEVGNGSTTREITAQQRGSDKVAKAEAVLAQGTAQATLSVPAARPGDSVALSAQGFAAGEQLGVYWGRINGQPSQTLQADSGGGVSKVGIRVGVAPVGNASLFLVGRTSGAAASAPFQVLGLYPTIAVKPYAIKAAQRVGFSGKGFVPGERVLVHVNSAGGQAVMALPTDQGGGFGNAGFVVPFGLTGQQSLVFIGEQSRATANAGFTVLPYQPQVRASAYGAAPGTSLRFFGTGFAPNEAVHVYAGATKGSAGTLVGAVRADGGGRGSGGSYMIPGDAQNDITFRLVGARSNASGAATVKVDSSGGPVDVPEQPPYQLPKDLEK